MATRPTKEQVQVYQSATKAQNDCKNGKYDPPKGNIFRIDTDHELAVRKTYQETWSDTYEGKS